MNREVRKAATDLLVKVVESEDPDFATIAVSTDSDHYNLVYKKEKEEIRTRCDTCPRRSTCQLMLLLRPRS